MLLIDFFFVAIIMDLYIVCAALVAAWGVRWLLAAPRRALTVAVRQGPALRAATALLWLPCALRDRFGVRVPRVGFMLGRPLSLAALMAAAERRTGLHDWGASASFPALFGLAVDRLNEARPSPVGRCVAIKSSTDFNMILCDSFDASSSAVLRELDESNRSVQNQPNRLRCDRAREF